MNIYNITVTNFNKHNKTIKKGHKATLIANNFCNDSKLGTLPLPVRWLFLNLILTCGDMTRDTIELNERQLRDMLESSWSIERALDALQSFQLLSYVKNEVFINRIEKKRKEDKRIEKNLTPTQKNDLTSESDKTENKQIWEVYFNAYRLRYGVEPVRNAQVNTQVSGLRKKLGFEDACKVVEFYLKHNDSWYLKNTHSFGLCLKNAETLRTQMLRGQAITQNEVRRFEKVHQQTSMIEDAKKGGF